MDFNGTVYRKFIDIVSDFTLQWTCKKLSFIEFGDTIKRQYSQLSEKALKITLFSIYVYLHGWTFFIYFNQSNILQKIEYGNR